MLTRATGEVDLEVPRDLDGYVELMIVKQMTVRQQHRLTGSTTRSLVYLSEG